MNQLLSNASKSLNHSKPSLPVEVEDIAGSLKSELLDMLSQRNGFYALENALHVYPSQSTAYEIGLREWNENALWRDSYKDLITDCLFFAEDIFGGQFCIKKNKIYSFDPETADLEYVSDSIDGWAREIVNNYNFLTGYPLARQWQEINGSIPPKSRLLPKIPFIAGGEFKLENLYLADSIEGMKFRAEIAIQVKNLPEGTQITFDITD